MWWIRKVLYNKRLMNFQLERWLSCWSMRSECRKSHDRYNRLDVRTSSWPLNNSTQNVWRIKQKKLKSNSAALEKISKLWIVFNHAKNSHFHCLPRATYCQMPILTAAPHDDSLDHLAFRFVSFSLEQDGAWAWTGPQSGSLRPDW